MALRYKKIVSWEFPVLLPSSSPSRPPYLLESSDTLPSDSKASVVFFRCSNHRLGFPGGTVVNESTRESRRHRRCGFNLWVRKIRVIRKWKPIPVFLPGEFHGQRSLVGYSPWNCKKGDTTEHAHTHTHTHTQSTDYLSSYILKLYTTRKMKLSVVPSYHPSPWFCPGLIPLVLWVRKAFRNFISNKYKRENSIIFTISRDRIVWKFHRSWSRYLKTWVWVQVLVLRDCRN